MQENLSLSELKWAERELLKLDIRIPRQKLVSHYVACGGLESLVKIARASEGKDQDEIVLTDLKFHENNPGYYEFVRLPLVVWKRDLIYATGVSLILGTIYAFTKDNTGAAFTSAIFWYIVGGCWLFGASMMLIGTLLGTKVKKKYVSAIMTGLLGVFICGGFYIAVYHVA